MDKITKDSYTVLFQESVSKDTVSVSFWDKTFSKGSKTEMHTFFIHKESLPELKKLLNI